MVCHTREAGAGMTIATNIGYQFIWSGNKDLSGDNYIIVTAYIVTRNT